MKDIEIRCLTSGSLAVMCFIKAMSAFFSWNVEIYWHKFEILSSLNLTMVMFYPTYLTLLKAKQPTYISEWSLFPRLKKSNIREHTLTKECSEYNSNLEVKDHVDSKREIIISNINWNHWSTLKKGSKLCHIS